MQGNYPFKMIRLLHTQTPQQRVLQWELDPTFQDLAPFVFLVEVSELPDFSSILYTLQSPLGYFAVDDQERFQGTPISLWYRIKLTTGSGTTITSNAISHNASKEIRRQWNTASEIIRKELVRFRYTGHPAWLLKRKNFGEQQADNLDPITKQPMTDNTNDQGTGFESGYYDPLKVMFSREHWATTVELSNQGFGTNASQNMEIRMIGFPLVTPYDVLVNKTNERFRVVTQDLTCMPGTAIPMIQRCQVMVLPPSDPIYSIPVSDL